jgi:alkaline phosphatase
VVAVMLATTGISEVYATGLRKARNVILFIGDGLACRSGSASRAPCCHGCGPWAPRRRRP